ncbi:MAG: hypothetical protein V1793_09685 [Pseudomonadota bacterium]
MTELLLKALASQILMVAAGTALLQVIAFRRKIRIWRILPSAWGMGMGLVYLTGYSCVKTGLGTGTWQMATLILFGILMGAGVFCRMGARASEPSAISPMTWYDMLIALVLVTKVLLIAYILVNNPVIDSDATNENRWMGLARFIDATGKLPIIHDRFGPSLLPLWVSTFLPRWHDSLVSLPWLFNFLAVIGLAGVTTLTITRNRTAALVVAYIYSAVPLISVHVIRPGYSDFLITYLLMAGLSPLVVAMHAGKRLSPMQMVMILCGLAACTLTKNEGIAWAALVFIMAAGYWCRSVLAVPWKTVLGIQAGFLVLGYIIYLFSSNYLYTHTFKNAGGHLKYVFQKTFDTHALATFFQEVFLNGSFSLLWWLAGMAAVLLLLIRKSSLEARIITVYSCCFFLVVAYLASFTGNAISTLAGGNVGRFLLQISGTAVPLFALAAKEVLIDRNTLSPES